ncbi:MAG: patatin-like phospholipase family protein [Thermomicrobiales bacterium]
MNALADGELFAGFTDDERATVRERLRSRHFAPGAALLHQGQFSAELHIIGAGAVRVWSSDSLGRITDLARLGPGQFVGEMSLLTGQPHSANVTAISPTEALVLGRDDFLALLGSVPRLAQNISRVLSERLTHANQQQEQAERTAIVAVSSPFELAAGPVFALNLAVSLARHTRRRTLLAVDPATLDGPLAPLRATVLPPLATVTAGQGGTRAHREAPPGHPALPGVSLCLLDPADDNRGPLTLLDDIYGQIVLATARAPHDGYHWAAGATRHLVLAPAACLGDALLVRTLAAVEEMAGSAGVVATDLPCPPSLEETRALTKRAAAMVLRGVPIALALLAHEPLPPTVRRDRRGVLAAAVDWLARDITGMKVGLALGAGSARGFAHVGILRVFEREGVPLDVLTGTSIGSIVAGAWASGLTASTIGNILGVAGQHLLPMTVPYASIFSNRNVRKALRRMVGERHIEHLAIPYAAVAVDLATREPVVLHRGPLWKAMLASAAIPGIYPPVAHDGRILIDGAVRDPLPAGVAADLGADIVIGVRLSPAHSQNGASVPVPATTGANLLDVVFTMLDVMQEAIESHGTQGAALIIHPAVTKVTLRQFQQGRSLVALGEQAGEEALPAIRRLFPWLDRTTPVVYR